MSEIIGEKITLKRLFGDEYYFNIPEYQRPYSWQKDNCDQLFDDIYESNRDDEYFLGTVILQEVGGVGTGIKYDVIDGQQRLTTIQILLACLRDKVAQEEYKISIQQKIYQKANPVDGLPEIERLKVREHELFRKFVQEKGGTLNIENYDTDNDAQENIKNAICIFIDRIKDLSQHEIELFIQHISQRCVFIYVSTKNFNDAYRLFTIINDRGLQLRRIDILKTNNLEPKVIPDPRERRMYSNTWECMENDLGADEFEDLISFIRTIEIKEKAKEDILKEFNNLIFDKGKIKRGIDFIDYVVQYRDIYQKLILDKDVNLGVNTIAYKNLISIMIEFLPSNEWIPSLLYYYKKFGLDNLYEFLLKLEKKFVSDWVIALTPTKRTVNLNSILKAIEEINSCDEIKRHFALKYDEQALCNELNENIYNKRHARYILLKLEYLESEHNVERKYSTISVEHVLPQNPSPSSKWVTKFDNENRNFYTNKLANLILLSHKKNSSASNYDFEEKKEKYLRNRITDLGRSQKILGYNDWTPEILEKRQVQIIELLKRN